MEIVLYNIILPKERTDNEFEKFMIEEVFPAVKKGPTRIGEIRELRLLKDIPTNGKYIWAIYWDGLNSIDPIDTNQIMVSDAFGKLRSSGADFSYLGKIQV